MNNKRELGKQEKKIKMDNKKLFTLGELYVADFLKPEENPRHPPVEMELVMEPNGLVRLNKTAPPEVMWGKYWYNSSINASMSNQLKDIVESITNVMELKENSLWIDCGSNDGTLLSFVPNNLIRVGIDPADDTFKIRAEKHANLIIQDYFTAKTFKESKFGRLKAMVFSSVAMFYDLPDPVTFIKDVYEILDDEGLWVMQLSHTPLMLKQLAFDNICHEHMYYYSLSNLKPMLEANGFNIVDCQLNDTNGGSFRVYIRKSIANPKLFAKQPHRDVCEFRIKSLLEYEKQLKIDQPEIWMTFYNEIQKLKEQVVGFIKEEKARGKTIYGYGASTKGQTTLQWFGLDNTLIDAIADRSPAKWGLRTVGTNIPIIPESEMRSAKPDYLLMLPWHFVNEFSQRESQYLANGGKFIVPCPKFEIICSE